MAKTLTINFANETKFDRDVDVFCELRGYQSGNKTNFVEAELKRIFQEMTKTHRLLQAQQQVTVED